MAPLKSRGKGTSVAFLSGGVSAACTTLLFQPLDLVKTRMQVHTLALRSTPVYGYLAATTGGNTVGMLETINTVIRRENFTALWNGTSPALQRCIPGLGVYFATVHFLKSLIGKTDGNISALQALSIGTVARAFAAWCFLPITVVKTRYESGNFQYRSVFQGLRSIWQTEGIRGLYSGVSATLVRDAPYSGLYVLFYTQSKQTITRLTGEETLPSTYHFPCGVLAGILASVTTQPADVVKTRMQLQPNVYGSFFNTLALIVHNNGVRGLFSGLLPRATRRTLASAFMWTLYEEIVRFIDKTLQR